MSFPKNLDDRDVFNESVLSFSLRVYLLEFFGVKIPFLMK